MSRRIVKQIFAPRSALPASAACLVANGVREALVALLGAPVEMRLFEPTIPPRPAWPAILRDALLYRVRGSLTDAAIVLRPPDAQALVTALFGERDALREPRELSPIERDVLDRTANAFAAHLGAVCGAREAHSAERVAALEGFVTFFEIAIEEPLRARVGLALSRDPSPDPRARIEAAHLGAVPLATRVTLDLGRIDASAIGRLVAGALLHVHARELHRCTLGAHGKALARGAFGVSGSRCALRVEEVCESA